MCEILVNDIFDELKDENQRISAELCFERKLNEILENMKNYSLILKNNCICSENIEVFKKLNDLEIDYKILKSKHKSIKSELNSSFGGNFSENIAANTSGIQISNVKSINSESKMLTKSGANATNGLPSEQTCDECHQKFGTELDLVLHVNRHHKQIESFVCHECKQVFDSENIFSQHLAEHKREEETSLLVNRPKPKSKITDFLRSYRKSKAPDGTTVQRERLIETNSHMRLITEMFKPGVSSQPTEDKRIKVEPNSDQIQCPETGCQMSLDSTEALEMHITNTHPSLVCNKCHQIFNSKNEIFAHLSEVHQIRDQNYCCPYCGYKTESKYSYDRHRRTKACQKGAHKCHNVGCTCSFPKRSTLHQHLKRCKKHLNSERSHSEADSVQPFDESDGRLSCHLCSYETKDKSNMKRHLNSHSNVRPFKCNTNGCDDSYNQMSHLKDHQKRVHKSQSQMKLLKELNKNIRNASKLDFLEELVEGQSKLDSSEPNEELIVSGMFEEDIKLELISDSDNETNILKNSPKKPNMESVSNNQHISEGKFSCKLCHFNTTSKVYLMLHEIQDHPESRPFKCECGKAYTRGDSLAKHKRTSHKGQNNGTEQEFNPSFKISNGGKLFECELCPFKTKFMNILGRHMISHNCEKPFQCDVDGCDYSARKRDNLRKHQKRVHKSDDSKFVCNYPNCKRRFNSQLMLRQHMNTHKNRFLCRWEGCQNRFDSFAKLNEHRRKESHMPTQLL